MAGFDKQRVLERVMADAPILSNRQGVVEVDGKERKIYAYYHNRGVRDPDLQYDRVANPIATTPDATLCEIYSFWEGEAQMYRNFFRGWLRKEILKKVMYYIKVLGLNTH